jgi:hypothetical protein
MVRLAGQLVRLGLSVGKKAIAQPLLHGSSITTSQEPLSCRRSTSVARPLSSTGLPSGSVPPSSLPAPVGSSEDKITQIYEGTNQIQRMVMARALLKT